MTSVLPINNITKRKTARNVSASITNYPIYRFQIAIATAKSSTTCNNKDCGMQVNNGEKNVGCYVYGIIRPVFFCMVKY
jgi:hypothetical protein